MPCLGMRAHAKCHLRRQTAFMPHANAALRGPACEDASAGGDSIQQPGAAGVLLAARRAAEAAVPAVVAAGGAVARHLGAVRAQRLQALLQRRVVAVVALHACMRNVTARQPVLQRGYWTSCMPSAAPSVPPNAQPLPGEAHCVWKLATGADTITGGLQWRATFCRPQTKLPITAGYADALHIPRCSMPASHLHASITHRTRSRETRSGCQARLWPRRCACRRRRAQH